MLPGRVHLRSFWEILFFGLGVGATARVFTPLIPSERTSMNSRTSGPCTYVQGSGEAINAMANPFHSALDEAFQHEQVRVHTAEHTYEGWCRIWNYHGLAILLDDAERDDGTHIGAVVIREPTTVERLTEMSPIEAVPLAAIVPSPYEVRDYDEVALASFARDIRERDAIPAPYPAVRPVADDKYELVSGHRRVAAVRQLEWDTLPVRILDCSDWEATRRFVAEHIPLPQDRESAAEEGDTESDDSRGKWYSEAEINQTVEGLRSDWSTERLHNLPALAPYLNGEESTPPPS